MQKPESIVYQCVEGFLFVYRKKSKNTKNILIICGSLGLFKEGSPICFLLYFISTIINEFLALFFDVFFYKFVLNFCFLFFVTILELFFVFVFYTPDFFVLCFIIFCFVSGTLYFMFYILYFIFCI